MTISKDAVATLFLSRRGGAMRYIPGIAVLPVLFSLAVAVNDMPRVQTVRGQVVSVDVLSRTLVIQTAAESEKSVDVSFATDDTSKFVKNGTKVRLRDLRPGDNATVIYEASHGKRLVVSIALRPRE